MSQSSVFSLFPGVPRKTTSDCDDSIEVQNMKAVLKTGRQKEKEKSA